MPIARLTSRTNPVLKMMRAVISRNRRAPADLIPAEGVRILEEATRSNCSIEMAIISESFGENPREDELLRTWATRNTKIYRTTESLLNSLSEVRTPQGAIALVRVSQAHLEQQASSRPPLILCACNISDPGNLGTLIRSARAADATLVVTTPGSVSPRGAKSVWSKINRAKAEALIASGQMRPAGAAAVESAKADGRWAAAYDSPSTAAVPDDFQAELDAHPEAKDFFATLNSANRYAILWRLQTAKRAETREKRMRQFIDMLERHEKLYP